MRKAIETAKRHHPRVRMISFGDYRVTGSAGNEYAVRCARRGEHRAVDCNCIAGQFGDACYHAAAALSLHQALILQKRRAFTVAQMVLTAACPKVERVGPFVI